MVDIIKEMFCVYYQIIRNQGKKPQGMWRIFALGIWFKQKVSPRIVQLRQ